MLVLAEPVEALPDARKNGLSVLESMTDEEFAQISPYRAAAMMGKRIVHPGGRFSTMRVLRDVRLTHITDPRMEVLEVGCGVGTMARKLAARGCNVTAIDLDPAMLAIARHRIKGQEEHINLRCASVERLPFADGRFARVVVESVTMFTDIDVSLGELFRVTAPGARVVDHEFAWARSPTPRQARLFAADFGAGRCETPDFWVSAYQRAGFVDVSVTTGWVLNFTPPGMLIDDGPFVLGTMLARMIARPRRLRRFARFVFSFNQLIPNIRYCIVNANKPQ